MNVYDRKLKGFANSSNINAIVNIRPRADAPQRPYLCIRRTHCSLCYPTRISQSMFLGDWCNISDIGLVCSSSSQKLLIGGDKFWQNVNTHMSIGILNMSLKQVFCINMSNQ